MQVGGEFLSGILLTGQAAEGSAAIVHADLSTLSRETGRTSKTIMLFLTPLRSTRARGTTLACTLNFADICEGEDKRKAHPGVQCQCGQGIQRVSRNKDEQIKTWVLGL